MSLKKLLTSDESTIRHKTTEVLFIIASNASGRNAFLEYEIILSLSKLVSEIFTIVVWLKSYFQFCSLQDPIWKFAKYTKDKHAHIQTIKLQKGKNLCAMQTFVVNGV